MPAERNTAIVIVTFKRQDLLQVLFQSLENLNKKPAQVIVVDNENSAETKSLVENLQAGFDQQKEELKSREVRVTYVPMMENTGGSGGFSKGVETAYKQGAEWIWVMDDDVRVFPDALDRLDPWFDFGLKEDHLAIQVKRKNFDGTDFYWQYDFKHHLGIPNPIAPADFKPGERYREINTACFEGGIFHRSLVQKLGYPDNRFFIYWDDTIYGYLASKVTKPILIDETVMARTRTLENVRIGNIRRLNSTSDMARYYIMRNRGHMAHYFMEHGDYKPFVFGFGTFLTLSKETIRLVMSQNRIKSFKILLKGMKDGKKLRKDTTWQAMPALTEQDASENE